MVEVLGLTVRGTGRSAYAPRDVINAPAIKTAIAQRSRQRGDSPEVQAWLLNHFYRHVVGNLQAPTPALQEVASLDAARKLFARSILPEWIAVRLKDQSSASLWWLDPACATVLDMEARLLEFLGSRQGTPLEGKLLRVNCPQALSLWAAEHSAFESAAALGWREHQPEAVRLLWQGQHGVFVELLAASAQLRAEMAFESQMMRHCLGQFSDRRSLRGGYGEHYASACEAGTQRLFSYRTGQNQPHITLSASRQDDGRWAVDQIKGKQNRPPIARYRGEVMGFLNSLDTSFETPPDAAAMGLFRQRQGWCSVQEIHDPADQLHVVHRYPALVRDLPHPSVLVQWLVAARQPELLRGLALAPNVAHAIGLAA